METIPKVFEPGFRLIDGNTLNDGLANPQWGVADSITAKIGGTVNTSPPIQMMLSNIATVGAAGAGVVLPVALPGKVFIILNSGANAITVFAKGSSTINGTSGATGVSQTAGAVVMYTSVLVGQWKSFILGALNSGGVFVWQLKMALAAAGNLVAVDNAIQADINNTSHIIWANGVATTYGDTLSNAIVAVIGASATQNAYTAAAGMSI